MLYYNNPPAEGRGGKTYTRVSNRPLAPDRFRHVPVRMNREGRVEPLYRNLGVHEVGSTRTFSYSELPLDALEADVFPDPRPARRQQKSTIVVNRIDERLRDHAQEELHSR